MAVPAHGARVTGPVLYNDERGGVSQVPLGPCLVEQIDHDTFDVIWGSHGQISACVSVEDLKTAEEHGNLVVLD
jgi:hypothetical protein